MALPQPKRPLRWCVKHTMCYQTATRDGSTTCEQAGCRVTQNRSGLPAIAMLYLAFLNHKSPWLPLHTSVLVWLPRCLSTEQVPGWAWDKARVPLLARLQVAFANRALQSGQPLLELATATSQGASTRRHSPPAASRLQRAGHQICFSALMVGI